VTRCLVLAQRLLERRPQRPERLLESAAHVDQPETRTDRADIEWTVVGGSDGALGALLCYRGRNLVG
jgi:hypothetical protein